MNFSHLEDAHQKWTDLLVIGKTVERDGKKFHILGMTMSDEARLYIIEPYSEPEQAPPRKKGALNQRQLMKKHGKEDDSYLQCREFCIGGKTLPVQSGSGGPMMHSAQNYEDIQLFLGMLDAGWTIPEWLRDEEWDHLQLVTLAMRDIEKLPEYSPETPITIKHDRRFIEHIVEKPVTLTVGKSRSFRFADGSGDETLCYINKVALIDVWKESEEQFNDPKYRERFSEEQIRQVKEECFEALEQSCPKGMCYVGIEYECSRDYSLQFYSKEFLRSFPETHSGRAVSLFMRMKPDREFGAHGLPLRGYIMQTAFPPNTEKIPAELFLYLEKKEAWEEII